MSDSLDVQANTSFSAVLEGAPSDLAPGDVGFTVLELPSGDVAIARTTTGMEEIADGVWVVTGTAPSTPGNYLLVWDLPAIDEDDPDGRDSFTEALRVWAGLPPSEATVDPRDLTTVEAVRRLLQKQVSDTVQDPLLQDFVTEASVLLTNKLGRQFLSEDAATKTFQVRDTGWVSLAPYDLRSVDEITYDSDGTSPITVTDGNWRLRDATPEGTYLGIQLTDYTRYRYAPTSETLVSITGDWGTEQVPADVERGVKVTVKTWLREGAAFTQEGGVVAFERVGKIPADVLTGLSHYMAPMVG